jgi:hypothetical protein
MEEMSKVKNVEDALINIKAINSRHESQPKNAGCKKYKSTSNFNHTGTNVFEKQVTTT